MKAQLCMIEGCTNQGYAPAGTGIVCKNHFADFVIWRRKTGGRGLFRKYNGMTMAGRDATVDEWKNTLSHSHQQT